MASNQEILGDWFLQVSSFILSSCYMFFPAENSFEYRSLFRQIIYIYIYYYYIYRAALQQGHRTWQLIAGILQECLWMYPGITIHFPGKKWMDFRLPNSFGWWISPNDFQISPSIVDFGWWRVENPQVGCSKSDPTEATSLRSASVTSTVTGGASTPDVASGVPSTAVTPTATPLPLEPSPHYVPWMEIVRGKSLGIGNIKGFMVV